MDYRIILPASPSKVERTTPFAVPVIILISAISFSRACRGHILLPLRLSFAIYAL